MKPILNVLAVVANLMSAAGCDSGASGPAPGGDRLVLGAYTTPREAYGKLTPLFADAWKAEKGRAIAFETSYLGSGAQSRAIIEGFEADVAALSLDPDIDRIAKAGLIKSDWRAGPTKGMVSRSIVAFAVRKGNPKGIKDWADLGRPGVEVLTPNPRTSGGAMWNVLALLGAGRRAKVDDVDLLKRVLRNVQVMDKGARESITSFEKGVGDVAITYENEVLVGRAKGRDYDLVIPRATILIENPIAVVDAYAERHGTRAAAEAFVAFLLSKEAQRVFADHGLRSVDAEVAKETADRFPAVADLFTIEAFGGWSKAVDEVFGETGIYSKAIAEVHGK
jgi:sulfate/thiosulfate-binding protein